MYLQESRALLHLLGCFLTPGLTTQVVNLTNVNTLPTLKTSFVGSYDQEGEQIHNGDYHSNNIQPVYSRLDDNECRVSSGLCEDNLMEWIVLGISIGLIVTTIITALTAKPSAKPCPREELGYKCRRSSSQKCECEE